MEGRREEEREGGRREGERERERGDGGRDRGREREGGESKRQEEERLPLVMVVIAFGLPAIVVHTFIVIRNHDMYIS